jgi:hypothetical protein
MDINTISSLFENRDFKSVARILEQDPPQRGALEVDDFIEVFGMAALTYANLEDPEKTIAYSGELLQFFFREDDPYEDRELIDALLVVRYRALCAIGDRQNAYELVKKAISKFKHVNKELEQAYTHEKAQRVEKMLSLVTRGLFLVSLLIVGLQYFLRIVAPFIFIFITLLIIILFIALGDNGPIKKMLDKIL